MIARYVRVSTAEQAENGYSIEEQIARTAAYCTARDWTESRVYADAGFSGGNTQRPGLQALIKDVKAGKVSRVLVYKLDRLSRSQLDTLYLIEKIFLANDCDFVSISENFDTGTAFGRAMIGILAVFAQLEREQIRERMMIGKQARAREGKFHGSAQVPIGYDYKGGELITNDFEKMQIVQIFEDYAAGTTPPAIAEKLNAAGLYQKGKPWLPHTVRQILKRRTYLGETYFGGTWYKGTHEAFISEELFDRVQEIRNGKTADFKERNRRPGKAVSYLGGFLYCAECGEKYGRRIMYDRNGEGKYRRYECLGRSGRVAARYAKAPGAKCKNKIWNEAELDSVIFAEIRKLAADPRYFEKTAAKSTGGKEAAITAQLAEIEKKTERLMDLYTDGEIPKKSLQERMHALNDQREKLDAELDAIRNESKEKTTKEQALPVVRGFGDLLERGDFDSIRAALSALIDRIVLDGDTVEIHWKF